jgi:hypothetical protein
MERHRDGSALRPRDPEPIPTAGILTRGAVRQSDRRGGSRPEGGMIAIHTKIPISQPSC